MLFNSTNFLFIFLPATLVGYYIFSAFSRFFAITWLVIVSILFYGYLSLSSLPVMLVSILVNYWFSLRIRSSLKSQRKLILIIGITANIIALCYFKYANILIQGFNLLIEYLQKSNINLIELALPLGISFFTFTQIAYLFDVYQGKIRQSTLPNYFLFVTFFPHLIAGPIIHHKQFMPQIEGKVIFRPNCKKISIGITILTLGLSKKLFLADNLKIYADTMFNSVAIGVEPNLLASWLGTAAFTFQLYFDFSGYSDMALGISLLFGIILPINFNGPFRATNIIDFWKRWHITLTKYFNEYLYTPVAIKMSRFGLGKGLIIETFCMIIIPLMITMIVIGAWHGANMTFILFGLMHGLFLVLNHIWRKIKIWKKISNKNNSFYTPYNILSWILTFISVNISFAIFRADNLDIALVIYKGLLGINGVLLPNKLIDLLSLPDENRVVTNIWQVWDGPDPVKLITYLAACFFIIYALPNTLYLMENLKIASDRVKSIYNNRNFITCKESLIAMLLTGLLLGLAFSQLNNSNEFLYFQF